MNVARRNCRMNCHGHDRLGRNNDAERAKVRLYDRLFKKTHPGTGDKDFLKELNPDSLKVMAAYIEPSLANVPAGQRFQFERHGYLVTDLTRYERLFPSISSSQPQTTKASCIEVFQK